jgi:tetratricopeptide (TPR) repeat protein
LTEASLRQNPDAPLLLSWRVNLEVELNLLGRAESSARKLVRRSGDELPMDKLGTFTTLARAYARAGRSADASRWCAAVREQLERSGADSAASLGTWESLGVAYWQNKQFDHSIPIFERIWAKRRKTRGDLDPATLRAQANLGCSYRDAGRLKEALPLLVQAEREGRAHPSLRWARDELLSAYALAGKTAEGTALAKEAVAAARREHLSGSPQLASALAQTGGTLLRLKAWAEAEPVLREALAIREKADPDAWTTFNAKSLLGGALAGRKEYRDAEPLLLQGYEGMKQRAATIPPQYRTPRLTEAVERLVQLNEALGRKDEAAKWRKEREAVRPP